MDDASKVVTDEQLRAREGFPRQMAEALTDACFLIDARTAEDLRARRAAELERFHKRSFGGGLRMVELKKQINTLAAQAGQEAPFEVAFLDTVRPADSQP